MKQIVMLLCALSIGVYVILVIVPNEKSKQIELKAPKLLAINGYSVISHGELNHWTSCEEYIVERNGKRDTVNIKYYRGIMTIQPR